MLSCEREIISSFGAEAHNDAHFIRFVFRSMCAAECERTTNQAIANRKEPFDDYNQNRHRITKGNKVDEKQRRKKRKMRKVSGGFSHLTNDARAGRDLKCRLIEFPLRCSWCTYILWATTKCFDANLIFMWFSFVLLFVSR